MHRNARTLQPNAILRMGIVIGAIALSACSYESQRDALRRHLGDAIAAQMIRAIESAEGSTTPDPAPVDNSGSSDPATCEPSRKHVSVRAIHFVDECTIELITCPIARALQAASQIA